MIQKKRKIIFISAAIIALLAVGGVIYAARNRNSPTVPNSSIISDDNQELIDNDSQGLEDIDPLEDDTSVESLDVNDDSGQIFDTENPSE